MFFERRSSLTLSLILKERSKGENILRGTINL